jgi:hypothetical protein
MSEVDHCISESSLLKNACRTGSSKKHELKSKQKLEKKLNFYTSRCEHVKLTIFSYMILIHRFYDAIHVICVSLPV